MYFKQYLPKFEFEISKLNVIVLTYRGEEAVAEHKTVFEAALARDASKAVNALEGQIRKGVGIALASM